MKFVVHSTLDTRDPTNPRNPSREKELVVSAHSYPKVLPGELSVKSGYHDIMPRPTVEDLIHLHTDAQVSPGKIKRPIL